MEKYDGCPMCGMQIIYGDERSTWYRGRWYCSSDCVGEADAEYCAEIDAEADADFIEQDLY
jgi:hypothetical protein